MSQIQGVTPQNERAERERQSPGGAVTHPTAGPVCVHYGGRQLIASSEMAGIFVRRAHTLLEHGESELVPLLHRDGIELLYISPDIPISVHDENVMPSDGSHHGEVPEAVEET